MWHSRKDRSPLAPPCAQPGAQIPPAPMPPAKGREGRATGRDGEPHKQQQQQQRRSKLVPPPSFLPSPLPLTAFDCPPPTPSPLARAPSAHHSLRSTPRSPAPLHFSAVSRDATAAAGRAFALVLVHVRPPAFSTQSGATGRSRRRGVAGCSPPALPRCLSGRASGALPEPCGVLASDDDCVGVRCTVYFISVAYSFSVFKI